MRRPVTASTRLAGVVGYPIGQSLSPVIFGAWIDDAGLDAVYVALAPPLGRFASLVEGLRGIVLGLNVTAPFKAEALAAADHASDRATRAGAANLLIFDAGGAIGADNTDGAGLMAALLAAPGGFRPAAGPAVILGAGGAARGAAAALLEAGAPEVRIVARREEAAKQLAAVLGGRARGLPLLDARSALSAANVIINATPQGQGGDPGPEIPLEAAPSGAVVMDMVYRPLRTAVLESAAQGEHPTVDGLAMLIAQAIPSFEAIFGAPPPATDVRPRALEAMGES
jgi:shikimate dehydrogenase